MSKLTHLNAQGEAHMVDVSDKADTSRTAIAQSQVQLTPEIVAAITDNSLAKGDLLATARIAGIQGAKKCSELIPQPPSCSNANPNPMIYIKTKQPQLRGIPKYRDIPQPSWAIKNLTRAQSRRY